MVPLLRKQRRLSLDWNNGIKGWSCKNVTPNTLSAIVSRDVTLKQTRHWQRFGNKFEAFFRTQEEKRDFSLFDKFKQHFSKSVKILISQDLHRPWFALQKKIDSQVSLTRGKQFKQETGQMSFAIWDFFKNKIPPC